MIVRDENGIIGQHNADYPNYLDFGDSAARTGIMAMCGYEQDVDNLRLFITHDYHLVRHPTQPQYADPKLTSRDQLIQWAAGYGVRKGRNYDCYRTILNYATEWRVNFDILTPDVKLFLYKCTGTTAPLWLTLLGTAQFYLSLLIATKLRPNDEMNKVICMCAVYGTPWLRRLLKWHPDIEANLQQYWSGYPWRDQPEIAIALHNYIIQRTRI